MNFVYLGLGSNIPDRKNHLTCALKLLSRHIKIVQISPIYQTPAMLVANSPSSWNRPFLNLVLKANFSSDVDQLFSLIQEIEYKIGREKNRKKWSPRKIDIDILSSNGVVINNERLRVPHPFLLERDFCLSPFSDIAGNFIEPVSEKKIINLKRKLKRKTPAFMDIFNFTPDSFSDGGSLFFDYSHKINKQNKKMDYQDKGQMSLICEKIKRNLDHHVQWMDVGGYSTRPGAGFVDVDQEWKRIHPFFDCLKYFPDHLIQISVDTFRPEIAEKALSLGVSAINDVSGLSDSRMISVLKNFHCDYVLMHSLSVPADKNKVMDLDKNPIQEIQIWLDKKLNELEKNHIHLDRIIFDPGIGFGKTAVQSLKIIQNIEQFFEYPVRIMVGHSNKSFMSIFSGQDRFFESIGLSIRLAEKGVDIIRVHEASWHARAWLSYKHGITQEKIDEF